MQKNLPKNGLPKQSSSAIYEMLSSETRPFFKAELFSIWAEHGARKGDMTLAQMLLHAAGIRYLNVAKTLQEGDFHRYFKSLGETFVRNADYLGTRISGASAVELIKLLRERAGDPIDQEIEYAGVRASKETFRSSIRMQFSDLRAEVNSALRDAEKSMQEDAK